MLQIKNTKEMRKVSHLLCSVLLVSAVFSCKDAEVDPEENELITTVKLEFTNGATVSTFSWKDADGDGGSAPVVDKIILKPNTEYSVKVSFLDESKSPAEDITAEVREESHEHLVVFTPSPSSLVAYTYLDKDANNFPIGLSGKVNTGAAGTGKLKVQLRHQPPVNGANVKNGTAAPGSDDANVDFDVELK
jgi:hypothetical protein